jgi:hypothetical protein
VVVGELTGFGRETQVCDRGDFEVGDFKTHGPFVFGLVLEFKAKELLLEVREAGFCCNLRVTNATGLVHLLVCISSILLGCSHRASSKLVGLAVIVLVVCRVSITVHSHDIGEHGAWAVVLVGVEEETETFKLVGVTKDISWLRALLGEPHGKAVAVEISLSMDLELKHDLLA